MVTSNIETRGLPEMPELEEVKSDEPVEEPRGISIVLAKRRLGRPGQYSRSAEAELPDEFTSSYESYREHLQEELEEHEAAIS